MGGEHTYSLHSRLDLLDCVAALELGVELGVDCGPSLLLEAGVCTLACTRLLEHQFNQNVVFIIVPSCAAWRSSAVRHRSRSDRLLWQENGAAFLSDCRQD